jgi:hypothetical protein
MNAPSIKQLTTISPPKRRWDSITPTMLGNPPSALIATMFGQSSISRRITVAGRPAGATASFRGM